MLMSVSMLVLNLHSPAAAMLRCRRPWSSSWAAVGIGQATKLYLDALLPPVLHCLDDAESRVRYYACESLYNIAKVCSP